LGIRSPDTLGPTERLFPRQLTFSRRTFLSDHPSPNGRQCERHAHFPRLGLTPDDFAIQCRGSANRRAAGRDDGLQPLQLFIRPWLRAYFHQSIPNPLPAFQIARSMRAGQQHHHAFGTNMASPIQ
jgi:hypothetical protein